MKTEIINKLFLPITFLGVFMLTGPQKLMAQDAAITSGPAPTHGGRNGGDALEIDLRRMARQIGAFLAGPVGREEFPQINGAHLGRLEAVEFDVTTEPVLDRHQTERTCVNQASTRTITCNINRWNMVPHMSTRYALLFHELLGLEGLEIGHDDNVSSYPISSRLLNYAALVESINLDNPVQDMHVGPSFGVTYKNRRTGDSIKLICAYDSPIHRCDTFTVVKTYNDLHIPFESNNKFLSRNEIRAMEAVIQEDIALRRMRYDLNGARVATSDYVAQYREGRYSHHSVQQTGSARAFGGTGLVQRYVNADFCQEQSGTDGSVKCGLIGGFLFPWFVGAIVIDTTAEVGIQVANLVTLPFRGIVQGFKRLKNTNRRNRLEKFFNVNEVMSMMNKEEKLTNRKYNMLIEDLEKVLSH